MGETKEAVKKEMDLDLLNKIKALLLYPWCWL